jgi:signal transduction histidine kinase
MDDTSSSSNAVLYALINQHMEKSGDLVWYIFASSVFTASVVVIFSILLYKQFKLSLFQNEEHRRILKEKELELINAVVKAQEDERTQIARDLHDDIGATLSMTQQKLSEATRHLNEDSEAIQKIKSVANLIEKSVTSLRSITNGMLPHYLLNFGLRKSVDRLFENAQESIGKPCLVVEHLPTDAPLTKEQEIHVYYIISELLNNTIKHAKPSYIDGEFQMMGAQVLFVVKHDGVAISQSDYEYLQLKNAGIGLSSIAHRVAVLNGSLTFERAERGGKILLVFSV